MGLDRITKTILAFVIVFAVSAKTAWSAELIPLRASYSSIGGAFAPLWLAQDKGLFAKYGLAVDLKYILSATGTQALFAGSIDIVNPATEIIEAGLGGQRVAFIVGILNRAVLSVYSKAESPPIQRPTRQDHGRHTAGIDHRSHREDSFSASRNRCRARMFR